ncbi:carbohydrate-binding domain-containing protein [Teredinibacter haidensis]|uniref:carbohydrate-binding domain-containing protein n=1 Tax=Teredinibacter haidensis TaxID=2731755 RepID=UPI000948C78A|nr:carbohydrate-binding domain-containing protein [Teredinibacter haidensis]
MKYKVPFKFSLSKLILPLIIVSLFIASSASAVKIMPLGDSITGSPGCWRAILWNNLQNNGYSDIDFVGTLYAQSCSQNHDANNEGHGGFLATDIANNNQLPGWLSSTNPDVVIMHLGTNDVWNGVSTSNILSAYSKLVDQMRSNNSNVKILVARLIPMDPSRSCSQCASRITDLNNNIPSWASGKSTSQSPITVVDQWNGFSAYSDTGDGVHPNDSGDQKIADRWFSALTSVLSTSSSDSGCGTCGSYPYCCNSTSDDWGWENNQSCITPNSSAAQSVCGGGGNSSSSSSSSSSGSTYPTCSSASADPDGDGWGWENNQSCVVSSGSDSGSSGGVCDWYGTSYPLCASTSSGWGWEDNQSCISPSTCSSQ